MNRFRWCWSLFFDQKPQIGEEETGMREGEEP